VVGQQGCKGGKLEVENRKKLERNEKRERGRGMGEYREKERRGRRFPKVGTGLMC